MAKNKILHLYIFSLTAIFLSGCVYLTHLDETLFMKNLGDNQQEMQAEINREEKLYNKLKTDIDRGRLNKQTQKRQIVHRYGKPTLCRPPEFQGEIQETCVYRQPTGGLSAQLIMLNFDSKGRLMSWKIQSPDK